MPKKSKTPEIFVTISGRRGVGKTCLAHKLALFLVEEDRHRVSIIDGDGETKRSESVADRFIDSRKITFITQGSGERTCVHCGCTDSRACAGGCHWVEKHTHTPTGVCSSCVNS